MSNYLIHYGVKGMKWGKHKYATYDDVVRTSRDVGRAQTKTAGLNAYNGYFDKDNPGMMSKTLFRRADGYHPDEEYNNQANAIYDANQKARWNDAITKHNYEKGLKTKASTYEQQRSETAKRQALEAAKVKASRDIGRAQSKAAAASVNAGYTEPGDVDKWVITRDGKSSPDEYNNQMVETMVARGLAKENLARVNSQIASYDTKTQNNVKKITSGKTTVSQVATNVVSKGKALLNSIFGKKKGK